MSIINKIKELINNFKSNTKLRAELEQKYKQALDEIEEFCKQNHYCLESEYRWFSDEIQDIISKAKETCK